MANKFEKSVLARLEDAENQKKIHPEKKAASSREVISENAADSLLKEDSIPDISEYLRREPQRVAKNKTFYLDHDLIETIKSFARLQGVTDSKLVNDILRQVLGLK